LTNDEKLFENLLHPTLIKLVDPKRFSEYGGKFLSDVFRPSKLRPNNLFEVYISQIANAKTGGERPDWLPDFRSWPLLKDVKAKEMKNEKLTNVIPKK